MPILSLSFVAQRYRKSHTPKRFIHLSNKPQQQFSSANPDTPRKNHALPPHYHLPPPTISSTQPHHPFYGTSPFPLPNATIPFIRLRFHSLTPAPFLRRDTIVSAHLRPSFSALVPSLLCTNAPTVAHLCTIFYRGNGAVLQCDQIVTPMLSERLYGGIREKSIEFIQKVYRVYSESL